MSPPDGAPTLLAGLGSTTRILIACGAGGVGKTTTAAALAAGVALRRPLRVLVLTVDPARRLADALGLSGLGDEARPVSSAYAAAGLRPKGELFAAMLDSKQSWDALVTRHAPTAAVAGEILANPYYRNLTERFARSHEYIAMERLYELSEAAEYDLIVLDTPPSLGALDFLDAPERMAEFFSSRLLRWLTVPARSRLVGLAARPFTQIADRLLGSQLLGELATFFSLFQSMAPGFVARAEAVSALLREPGTAFVVLTSAEAAPVHEARTLVAALAQRRLPLALVVANKTLPPAFSSPAARRSAAVLETRAGAIAQALSRELPESFPVEERAARVLREVGASFSNYTRLAGRERTLLRGLGGRAELARLPHLMHEVNDLGGLLELADHLFGSIPA